MQIKTILSVLLVSLIILTACQDPNFTQEQITCLTKLGIERDLTSANGTCRIQNPDELRNFNNASFLIIISIHV